MASYYDNLLKDHIIENPIYILISQITNYIKNLNDYETAIKLIKENNLKLEDIVKRTSRLTNRQVVELAKRLILAEK